MYSLLACHSDFILHLSRELISRHPAAGDTNIPGISLTDVGIIQWPVTTTRTHLISSATHPTQGSHHVAPFSSQTPFRFINSSIHLSSLFYTKLASLILSCSLIFNMFALYICCIAQLFIFLSTDIYSLYSLFLRLQD